MATPRSLILALLGGLFGLTVSGALTILVMRVLPRNPKIEYLRELLEKSRTGQYHVRYSRPGVDDILIVGGHPVTAE